MAKSFHFLFMGLLLFAFVVFSFIVMAFAYLPLYIRFRLEKNPLKKNRKHPLRFLAFMYRTFDNFFGKYF